MVRKTTDKSQKVKQNVKQSVNVKVQIGDYKKKSKKGKGKPRRKAAARGGVGEHNPYAQSYNPVYIQSGNAPDLAKETKEAKELKSNNPLLSAIEDLTNNIKRTHVENVTHPLTKVHFNTPEKSILNESEFTSPLTSEKRSIIESGDKSVSIPESNESEFKSTNSPKPSVNESDFQSASSPSNINSFESSMSRASSISPITPSTPYVNSRGRASSFDMVLFPPTPKKPNPLSPIQEVIKQRERSPVKDSDAVSYGDVYPASLVQDRIASIEKNNPLNLNTVVKNKPKGKYVPKYISDPLNYIQGNGNKSVLRDGPTGKALLKKKS